MLIQGTNESHMIVLERGQKLMATLTELAKEHNWQGGHFYGIGAVKDAELGAYDLPNKKYIREKFTDGDYELVSAIGNLSWNEGAPFVHMHVTLGRHDFSLFGGHLFEATVAVIAEFSFLPLGVMPERQAHKDIGLNVICNIV